MYKLSKQKFEGTKKIFYTLILAFLIVSLTAASVSAEAITNSFSGSPTSGEAPLEVQFTSVHTGPGTPYYFWKFGDGSTSTDPNPTHTYMAPGKYTVTLTVKTVLNGGGFVLQSISRGKYITVYLPPV